MIRALILTVLCATLSGCATTRPWESARIGCLQYANAACIAAIEDGYPAGVVSCTLPGTFTRHAVTVIIDDGKRLYWDAAFGRYRTRAQLGKIHSMRDGPSRGAYGLLPNLRSVKESP